MLLLIEAIVCLRLTVADKTAWPRLCDVVGAEGCACALSGAGSERHPQTARCSEASESRGEAAVLSGFGASKQRRTLQKAFDSPDEQMRAAGPPSDQACPALVCHGKSLTAPETSQYV